MPKQPIYRLGRTTHRNILVKLLPILTTEPEEEHTALPHHYQAIHRPQEAGTASLGTPAHTQPKTPLQNTSQSAHTRDKKFSPNAT